MFYYADHNPQARLTRTDWKKALANGWIRKKITKVPRVSWAGNHIGNVSFMAKANWKPKAISDDAKEWLAKPMNQELLWDKPQAELKRFLKGDDQPLGGVAYDLGNMAFRFSVLAEANVLDQPAESLNYLIQSQQYQLKRYQIFMRVNALDHRPEKQGKVGFNEAGIFLARLIALGYFSEADELFPRMLLALKEKFFYGINSTGATPFIFGLYARSQGKSVSFDGFEVKRVDLYEKLVDLLPGDNLNEVTATLKRACDYHVERGQYGNDEVDYEYDSELERIYPAEILAFLRLRQKMGLAVPEIKHLTLDNPLAKLHEPKPFPEDPFLNQVAEAAEALLRKQESGGSAPAVKRGPGGLLAFPFNRIKKYFQ